MDEVLRVESVERRVDLQYLDRLVRITKNPMTDKWNVIVVSSGGMPLYNLDGSDLEAVIESAVCWIKAIRK